MSEGGDLVGPGDDVLANVRFEMLRGGTFAQAKSLQFPAAAHDRQQGSRRERNPKKA